MKTWSQPAHLNGSSFQLAAQLANMTKVYHSSWLLSWPTYKGSNIASKAIQPISIWTCFAGQMSVETITFDQRKYAHQKGDQFASLSKLVWCLSWCVLPFHAIMVLSEMLDGDRNMIELVAVTLVPVPSHVGSLVRLLLPGFYSVFIFIEDCIF